MIYLFNRANPVKVDTVWVRRLSTTVCMLLPWLAFAPQPLLSLPMQPALPLLGQATTPITPIVPGGTRQFLNPISSAYRLGPGDQLQITVVDYKEFSGPQTILSDGTVSVPVLGPVPAANRTSEQFASELSQRLRALLKNPVVTVAILNARPLLITVAGEVQRPGLIQLRNFNPVQTSADSTPRTDIPTINLALSEAGGVTRSADIRRVVLRRMTSAGETKTTINLWDALFTENAAPSIVLRDGDALFIPTLAAGETLDSRMIARTNLAPKTVKVRVVGEVKKPGEVEVPPNSSISSAVAIAGGPTDKAQLRRVGFVRLGGDGKIERREIDLRNLTDTYQIQDGDVVIVPKSAASSVFDFATPLFNPLGVFFNLFR
jgi:polysaccharide biosynthesis/export protein